MSLTSQRMGCKIMFIERARGRSAEGFTLVETLIATTIFSVAIAAVMLLYMFSTRSFATLANYAQLDQMNRTAMDNLTRELRGAYYVNDVRENSITFLTTNMLAGG